MIDITGKHEIPRTAIAKGTITLSNRNIQAIEQGNVKKGDVFEISRVAGITAVKQTPLLIPMCHPIPIEKIGIMFRTTPTSIIVRCEVKTTARTGVEMEALMGVSAALMNIWDMVKYLEKDKDGQYPETRITDIHVVEKRKHDA
mgnify:CR=1 FL=1